MTAEVRRDFDGQEVTIASWSMGMTYALKAAEELEKEGISAEVIDLRTLRPMDTQTIVQSVMKTGRCVVVEECWPQSGVAAEVSARALYEEAATHCHSVKDYVSRDLFEKLMHDEEEHIDFLETQLDLVAKLGLQLYAQHHIGELDDDKD